MQNNSKNPFQKHPENEQLVANLNEMLEYATPEDKRKYQERLKSALKPKNLLHLIPTSNKLQII
jgi:hypothetical protein